MIKKFTLIIVSFFILSQLSAQGYTSSYTSNSSSDDVIKRRTLVTSFVLAPTVDWLIPRTDNMTETKLPKAGFRGGITFDIDIKKNQNYYASTGVMVKYLAGNVHLDEIYTLRTQQGALMDTFNVDRTVNTFYIVIPTGVKLKTKPSRGCVFAGSFGFYHSFRIGGKTKDEFIEFPGSNVNGDPVDFNVKTVPVKNNEAAIYTFTPYAGLGFEYQLRNGQRASFYAQYAGAISNYFAADCVNSVTGTSEKALVHSLEFLLGFSF